MNTTEDDDPRVIAAVEEYMTALEGGRPPDVNEFLQRHGDIAGLLRECLAGLRMVHEATPALQGDERPAAMPSAEPLGDFHIMKEIGRGGMGVVYEAVQLTLARRVALKVLPFASALDPRHLQRFKNEAQAAALLHHPNIVPVFAVGCERGVHFYAMQLIDGNSLATLLDELRLIPGAQDSSSSPLALPATENGSAVRKVRTTRAALTTRRETRGKETFRTHARLIAEAARALDHAHQLGVVHRDIKPGNLLLDRQGKLWVTDFGLAQMQNDVNLTRSGELLGTLRYMSPEQALSRPTLIDHRTDVYSLGATLYELLTLTPVFEGSDRQELLRRIAGEDPTSPRKLDSTVPAELETIALKALSKHPGERYATAGEMADDLQRFLDDQPIRARPPTLAERVMRWSRRHRSVVMTGVVVLFLLLAGLTVSTFLIARAYEAEREQTEEARKQRQDAEENYRRARDAVNLLVQISEEELADKPYLRGLRRRLLEGALEYYQDFINRQGNDSAQLAELDGARLHIALIIRDLATLEGHFNLSLVFLPEVQEELELEGDQQENLKDLKEKLDTNWRQDFVELPRLDSRQREQRFVDRAREQKDGLAAILTARQIRRLEEVALQQRGAAAFLDPDVADRLMLKADQKIALRKLIEESGPMMGRGNFRSGDPPGGRQRPGEAPDSRRRPGGEPPDGRGRFGRSFEDMHQTYVRQFRDTMTRALAILTEPQKTRWNKMIGEPCDVPFRTGGPREGYPYPMPPFASTPP